MANFEPLSAVHFQQRDPGVRWEKDAHITIDLDHPLDSERILTPNVIRLPSGGYRMYFEARSPDRPTVILSASSEDGLTFTPEEGVRFGDEVWSYGTPRVLYVDCEAAGILQYRMYFHRYTFPLRSGLDAGNHIISARSSDGLTFEEEPGVRIAQETDRESFSVYAPEVIRLGDGSYRMYYSGWSETVRGGVFTATSSDGLTWQKGSAPCIELGGSWDSDMVSEPCAIELDDGRSRLFYEACDDDEHYRILAATSAPAA